MPKDEKPVLTNYGKGDIIATVKGGGNMTREVTEKAKKGLKTSQKSMFNLTMRMIMVVWHISADDLYNAEDLNEKGSGKCFSDVATVYSWCTRSAPKNERALENLVGLFRKVMRRKYIDFDAEITFEDWKKEIESILNQFYPPEKVNQLVEKKICESDDLHANVSELLFFVYQNRKKGPLKATMGGNSEKGEGAIFEGRKTSDINDGKNKDAKENSQTVHSQKYRGLVVFDVDGTLIKGIKHSWTPIYQKLGVSPPGKENKRRFLNGEISYPEWCRIDLLNLQSFGLTYKIAREAAKGCSLTKNLREGIAILKEHGYQVGIISGGADVILNTLLPDVDELFNGNVFINQLLFDKNTGKLQDIIPTPYDWDDTYQTRGVQGKNVGLKNLCRKYNIDLSDAVFVGDDENDFRAMEIAGRRYLYSLPNQSNFNDGRRSIPNFTEMILEDDLVYLAKRIVETEPIK